MSKMTRNVVQLARRTMPEPEVDTMLGTPAPDFRLPASTGGEIGLSDAQGKSNIILFFVREHN
jgi:hypothetical protein